MRRLRPEAFEDRRLLSIGDLIWNDLDADANFVWARRMGGWGFDRAVGMMAASDTSVPENEAPQTVVGTLSTTDPDPGDTFTYSLVSGPGAEDNGSFVIDADQLQTRPVLDHAPYTQIVCGGKLYFSGFGERSYTGGGFGWYDPKTEDFGGFWKPLSGYAVHWIAPVLGGRLIAISTSRAPDELKGNQAPPEAKLFVYDVTGGKIVREIVPIAKARTSGLIVEVAPARLLGLTTKREHADGSILYGVDVSTGEVLFRKTLPSPVSTDAYWPHWVDPSYVYEHLTLLIVSGRPAAKT